MDDKKKIKVMLVDDEVDFRTLMKFWLNSKNYDVIVSGEGEAAIQMVKDENPDILFLDIRMPGMDGVDILKGIRKFNKDLPIIVISAYVNDPRARGIMSHDVSGVFYKGKNFEEALPLLEAAMRTHKKLR